MVSLELFFFSFLTFQNQNWQICFHNEPKTLCTTLSFPVFATSHEQVIKRCIAATEESSNSNHADFLHENNNTLSYNVYLQCLPTTLPTMFFCHEKLAKQHQTGIRLAQQLTLQQKSENTNFSEKFI